MLVDLGAALWLELDVVVTGEHSANAGAGYAPHVEVSEDTSLDITVDLSVDKAAEDEVQSLLFR